LALLCAEELGAGGVPIFESSGSAAILERTRSLLLQGAIVAIKGLGGFHLACVATNDRAVSLLRERKRRSGKAFAIMVRDVAAAEELCEVTESDRALLESPQRPIVLMQRRREASLSANAGLSPNVAPGNESLGVLLPYTPLHHLLFEGSPGLGRQVGDLPNLALVMTSGNLSEEPIVSRNEDAWPRLKGLADHFLLHNREIQTRVDDSVVRSFEGREYPVRLSGAPVRRDAPLFRAGVAALEQVGEGFGEIELQPRRGLVREPVTVAEDVVAVLGVRVDFAFDGQHVEDEGGSRSEIGAQLPFAVVGTIRCRRGMPSRRGGEGSRAERLARGRASCAGSPFEPGAA
jgi:tRNA A37 threonylcarbamoyladenosine synthetase subunit TsaC/SUA5/YrdC